MKKRLLSLTLALALLCSSCAGTGHGNGEETPPEGQYSVYFPVDDPAQTDLALGREFHALPEGAGEVEGLMTLLLSGPQETGFASPFPEGTGVRSWRQEGGLVSLDMTEAYGGLSGVELTLADACVVLTLCQLKGVNQVYLTVEGRPRPFRDQVLTAGEFDLTWAS